LILNTLHCTYLICVFYLDLNLLDWGKHNILAVALRGAVYLWNESTGKIQQLMEMPSPEDYISSVSWIEEGNILAIGDTHGAVQVHTIN
jgi:cell division cycle protein 20 (cofactor of APC complex)